MNRRNVIGAIAATSAIAAAGRLVPSAVAAADQGGGVFKLSPLGYGYDALEPFIDTATMTVHHSGHHKAYVDNANKLVAAVPELATKSIEDILSSLEEIPEATRNGVRNNLGGHYNHELFWDLMTPGGSKDPAGDLKSAIEAAFGSIDAMKEAVNKAALAQFGSGWAWLALDKNNKLVVFGTPNQDTPHMRGNGERAIIGVDVWEHAYYLKHMNKRAAYLADWWNVLNWDKAAANFKAASG
jgi:superoxide dismutase, Fe-Mn family